MIAAWAIQRRYHKAFQAIVPRADWPGVRRLLKLGGADFAAVPTADGKVRVIATICPETPDVTQITPRTLGAILATIDTAPGLECSPGWTAPRSATANRGRK